MSPHSAMLYRSGSRSRSRSWSLSRSQPFAWALVGRAVTPASAAPPSSAVPTNSFREFKDIRNAMPRSFSMWRRAHAQRRRQGDTARGPGRSQFGREAVNDRCPRVALDDTPSAVDRDLAALLEHLADLSRPRCTRDFIPDSETPSISAASFCVRPWSSVRVIASRYGDGSRATNSATHSPSSELEIGGFVLRRRSGVPRRRRPAASGARAAPSPRRRSSARRCGKPSRRSARRR